MGFDPSSLFETCFLDIWHGTTSFQLVEENIDDPLWLYLSPTSVRFHLQDKIRLLKISIKVDICGGDLNGYPPTYIPWLVLHAIPELSFLIRLIFLGLAACATTNIGWNFEFKPVYFTLTLFPIGIRKCPSDYAHKKLKKVWGRMGNTFNSIFPPLGCIIWTSPIVGVDWLFVTILVHSLCESLYQLRTDLIGKLDTKSMN